MSLSSYHNVKYYVKIEHIAHYVRNFFVYLPCNFAQNLNFTIMIRKRLNKLVHVKESRVHLYFGEHEDSFKIPVSFCTPKLLIDLAIYNDCIFLTCDKYGCRQFCNPNFEHV